MRNSRVQRLQNNCAFNPGIRRDNQHKSNKTLLHIGTFSPNIRDANQHEPNRTLQPMGVFNEEADDVTTDVQHQLE